MKATERLDSDRINIRLEGSGYNETFGVNILEDVSMKWKVNHKIDEGKKGGNVLRYMWKKRS